MKSLLPIAVLVVATSSFAAERTDDATGPRLRAELAGGVSGGHAGPAASFGPGLFGALGVLLNERLALSLRVSFDVLVIVNHGSVGVAVELWAAPSLVVSVGTTLEKYGSLATDLPSATAWQVPLRLEWAPMASSFEGARREGLVLSAEVAPGFAFAGSRGFVRVLPTDPPAFPAFAVSAGFHVGYAWF